MTYILKPGDTDQPLPVGGPQLSPQEVRQLTMALQKKQAEEKKRKEEGKGQDWRKDVRDSLTIKPEHTARVRIVYYDPRVSFDIHYVWQKVTQLCQVQLGLECPYCKLYGEPKREEWPVVMWVYTITNEESQEIEEVNRLVALTWSDSSASPLPQIFNHYVKRLRYQNVDYTAYDFLITRHGERKETTYDVYPDDISTDPFYLPEGIEIPSLHAQIKMTDARFKRWAGMREKAEPQQTTPAYTPKPSSGARPPSPGKKGTPVYVPTPQHGHKVASDKHLTALGTEDEEDTGTPLDPMLWREDSEPDTEFPNGAEGDEVAY